MFYIYPTCLKVSVTKYKIYHALFCDAFCIAGTLAKKSWNRKKKSLFYPKFDVFLQPINENKGNNLGAINLSSIEVNVSSCRLAYFRSMNSIHYFYGYHCSFVLAKSEIKDCIVSNKNTFFPLEQNV